MAVECTATTRWKEPSSEGASSPAGPQAALLRGRSAEAVEDGARSLPRPEQGTCVKTSAGAESSAARLGQTVRPRLRGWLHAGAAPVVLAAGIVLVTLADPGTPRLASVLYAVTALMLFASRSLRFPSRTSRRRSSSASVRIEFGATSLVAGVDGQVLVDEVHRRWCVYRVSRHASLSVRRQRGAPLRRQICAMPRTHTCPSLGVRRFRPVPRSCRSCPTRPSRRARQILGAR